jgi:hypothetical protein
MQLGWEIPLIGQPPVPGHNHITAEEKQRVAVVGKMYNCH